MVEEIDKAGIEAVTIKVDDREDFINKFKNDFFEKYGLVPEVLCYTHNKTKHKLPISILEYIVNQSLFSYVSKDKYPGGIRQVVRTQIIVMHRQIFMKIAWDWNYSTPVIGRYLRLGKHEYDHATVIHACRQVENLTTGRVRDKKMIEYLNKIEDGITERLKIMGLVSNPNPGEDNTQSVIPLIINEGEIISELD